MFLDCGAISYGNVHMQLVGQSFIREELSDNTSIAVSDKCVALRLSTTKSFGVRKELLQLRIDVVANVARFLERSIERFRDVRECNKFRRSEMLQDSRLCWG